jgi:OPA family glycerol-3-phosphate transporter-like MFS transporter 3
MYSLCYACLKLVNYSFFFWLPFYLHDKFHWAESDADLLSTLYDVGGIIGGIVGGLLSDIVGFRSIVVVPALIAAVPVLFIFSNLANNKLINGIVMTVTGIFIGGPANMISAAITADLGRQEVLAASDQALSTVTGIVDGTGSFGAAIGQILIPIIQESWENWRFVFYFFIIMTFVTCLCILPLFIRECKQVVNKIKTRYAANDERNYDTI